MAIRTRGFWEQHCEKHLFSVGFEAVRERRSCYWHKELELFLVVYVDDFKMSGPVKNIDKGWDLIRKGVTIGKVEDASGQENIFPRTESRRRRGREKVKRNNF